MGLFSLPNCPKCGRETTETGWSFPYPALICKPCVKKAREKREELSRIEALEKEVKELKKLKNLQQGGK